MCGLARPVHVYLPQALDRYAEVVSHLFHVRFGDEHALWAAKAAERRVRDGVGLGDAATHVDIGDLVTAVAVGEAALDDSAAQVLGPAAIAEYVSVEALNLAVDVDSDFPGREERMPLA